MYILKGRRRHLLRCLILIGLLANVFAICLDHLLVISAVSSLIFLNIYFVSSMLILFITLRESSEKSSLMSPGLLGKSPGRHAIFFYLVYGSAALYSLVEKRFQSENILVVGLLFVALVVPFPDVLLFLRTKVDSGKAVYQKANRVGFGILLLFVIVAVGVGIVAGR
jgi:hypothetical protein